ncbi:hypothetical protein SAMN05518669_11021 [Variovorax sp. YR634]|nr:hypothetical protein SAMN05518669_11021 [Variovorax sp. YR634]
METICERLADGSLRHSEIRHIFEQLAVEGRRRIDAFVFELLFRNRMRAIAQEHAGLTLSFGWHIGYDGAGNSAYWFRLIDEEDGWNACDEALLSHLAIQVQRSGIAIHVFRVMFRPDTNGFVSSERVSGAWRPERELAEALADLTPPGTWRPPRSMDHMDTAMAYTAFDWMSKYPLLLSWLPALSIQRRLMNCILSPALGRDPTDIDMMVLSPAGQLRCVEFKRKYPASGSQSFGLDLHPHVNTVRMMDSMGIAPLHILLVAPRWQKNESPLHWLDDRALNTSWTWLAASLGGEDAFLGPPLKTHGWDSGQRNASRQQFSISWSKIRRLHEGLKLGDEGGRRMVEFLTAGDLPAAPPATFHYLSARRLDR